MQPTRLPQRNCVQSVHFSASGGLTWSYQPPHSSQVMKTTVLGQSPPLTMASIWVAVQWSPAFTDSTGCSLIPVGPYTHETVASLPAAASVTNCAAFTLFGLAFSALM